MLSINPEHYDFSNNPTVQQLIRSLETSSIFSDSEAEVFVDFPLYKGVDDNLIISQLIIISELFGVFAIYASDKNQYDPDALYKSDEDLLEVANNIFSRLVRK